MTGPGNSPPTPTPTPTPEPPNEWLDLARSLARSMLPLSDDHHLQRDVIVTFARRLRETLANEREACGPDDAVPNRLRHARELAHATDRLTGQVDAARLVADLRLFARLSIGECADLLHSPRALLLHVWRAAKRSIFATTRTNLANASTSRGPRPDR